MSGGTAQAATTSAQAETTDNGSGPKVADTPESLAVEQAAKLGRAVDVPSMRTEFSEVTARPDGTLESVTHTQAVRTRKDGAWAEIDPTLKATADGMVAPKAVLSELEFSGGGDQPLVRMVRAGKAVELRWPGPLPKPQLDGGNAVYPSVLPGVDLRMTATRTGFNQLLVVKTKEAADNTQLTQIRLGLNTDGLTVRAAADGSLEAIDQAAGGTVFTAPKPMMYDSSAGAKEGPGGTAGSQSAAGAGGITTVSAAVQEAGGEGPVVHATPVTVEVSQDGTGTGAENALVLTPPRALLDDSRTVYPVYIDPAWDTPHTSAWAGISRANPSQPYYKFSYNSTYVRDFGTGYCASPTCSAADVKRVLYRIPVTSKFSGKHILSAEFNVYESFSYSCTAKPVQLYLTKAIGTGTTWNNATTSGFWSQRLQTTSAAKGWGAGCPAGYLEFGGTSGPVKDLVQRAATGAWTNIVFGLKAEDEDDAGAWKRFTDDASLRVRYNLPPRQAPMSALSMSPGSTCSSTGLWINRIPQVTAVVTDPDNEKLGVQFAAAWDAGDGGGFKRRWWSTGAEATAPASSAFKASGSSFSVTLPSSIPKGKTIGWEVRGWDSAEWGPWSSTGTPTDCYFTVDTSMPAGPSIVSADYPGSGLQSDELPWTDGVGRYGTFALSSTSTDVVKYQYGLDTGPSAANEKATTSGAAQSVSLLINTAGPHFLSVKAIDKAGNASQPETYYFNVLSGHPQRAGWSMNESKGATTLAGAESTFETTLGTGAARGAEGHSGSAVSLDGTTEGWLTTDRAVLETNRSFTLSAWVKPDAVGGRNATAVAQLGQHHAVTLGLLGDKWVIKAPTQDVVADTSWYTAASTTPAVPGRWTHIAGAYDASAKTLTLYVDGVPSATVTGVTMWSARGALTFGRTQWRDNLTDPWAGALDDVALWDRSLSAAEVTEAAAGRAVKTGLPAKAVWNFDETTATMLGHPETTDATLHGGAATGTEWSGGNAVHFDGKDDYARTTRPQVDGTRNFSVSAWVRTPTPAAGDTNPRMIVTQNGVQQNEFSLYYSAYAKKWKFGRYTEDTASATLYVTQQPACTGPINGVPCFGQPANEWTHLLGVSDVKAGKLRLFVNGYLVGEDAYTQVKPWASPGGVQIGAVNRAGANEEFFNGDMADVRIFDRVVTSAEAKAMVKQRPQLAARWKFDQAPGTPAVTPDALGKAPATLYKEARINAGGGPLSTGSLILDGTDDYAATATMPLRTGESFSIAGWAQTAANPNRDMTMLSVAGTNQSAVEVGWDYLKTVEDPFTGTQYVGQWRVSVTDSDGTTSTRTTAVHTFDPGLRIEGWNHLAVVYDGFSDQLSLYVNGALENQVCSDEDTTGTCTDHVSWASVSQPFQATGQVQFGRERANGAWGSYFSGEIDDVWMYQGALSAAQVISLADPNTELATPAGA